MSNLNGSQSVLMLLHKSLLPSLFWFFINCFSLTFFLQLSMKKSEVNGSDQRFARFGCKSRQRKTEIRRRVPWKRKKTQVHHCTSVECQSSLPNLVRLHTGAHSIVHFSIITATFFFFFFFFFSSFSFQSLSKKRTEKNVEQQGKEKESKKIYFLRLK